MARIKLPPGFKISLFASDMLSPRQIAISPSGTVFVGTRVDKEGVVYALPDRNKDGRADEVIVVAGSMRQPNGVALKDGALYVAEINKISRFDNIEKDLKHPPRPVVIAEMPSDTHHGWKYIRFSPDGKLFWPQGAPCNVCEPSKPVYGTLNFLDASGKSQNFARGIRNTVGFDWQPGSGVLWFTDNGRDNLGDDRPPDELNSAPKAGMHFGFPYRWGDNQKDPEFGDKAPADLVDKFAPPAMCLGAHVASLGMRFYTGKSFPKAYQGNVFIAEHGSWNRSKKSGYRITMATIKGGKAVKYEPFATGWLDDASQDVGGRPVDLVVASDGSLLVSDDYAGNIYRISYQGK
ncbi:MAG: PQQ-dependent sugar dehydrogenase [Cyanobacteria bacterium REEB67]|nr:PQQ-dependent sugar dehydrogenase [Cyanobacteria bacterium REEB67]